MARDDLVVLNHNIKNLEDKVIAVKFWVTRPEFIVNAKFQSWNRFLDLESAPIDQNPNNCMCSDCVIKKQQMELRYTNTGFACCPCEHSLALIAKNLKRGHKFVITNNAGVTEATVTMHSLKTVQGLTKANTDDVTRSLKIHVKLNLEVDVRIIAKLKCDIAIDEYFRLRGFRVWRILSVTGIAQY